VIAGAPAFNFWGFAAWLGNAYKILGFTPDQALVNLPQFAAIQQEVFKQCDRLDGALDGILEDPEACKLNWEPLLCSSNNSSSTCLTPAQKEIASKLFEQPTTYNGKVLYPGHRHGPEPRTAGGLYQEIVMGWVGDIFGNLVFNKSYDSRSFTLSDANYAYEQDFGKLSSYDPNISAFRNRGGKVIHYHGVVDSLLPFTSSDLYYKNVQKALKASVKDLDKFYRYFRASGVDHCFGGPGANFFGQGGGGDPSADPDDNVLMRIVAWVEKGKAPEFIRGTKYVNDTKALGVEFTRKHCKYPKVNSYVGKGDGKDEEGWRCV